MCQQLATENFNAMAETRRWNLIETVGLLAVVISLILVAYELRQTREAIHGETYLQITQQISSTYLQVIQSEGLVDAIVDSMLKKFEELTPRQQIQMQTLAAAKRFELDAYFYQYELGFLNEEFYESVLKQEFLRWYPRMVYAGVWEVEGIRPNFKEAVERAVSDSKTEEGT